jgi:hypothetical protein
MLTLFNVMGERELEVSLNSSTTSVQTSWLPSGIYFYQLKAENDVLRSGKIIVTDK